MHLPGDPPPNKPRLKRWWLMLTQFCLNIVHIPGAKNELADFLSRHCFEEKFQVDVEDLARKAFQRMDIQLDLRLECVNWNSKDFEEDASFSEVWKQLEPGKSKLIGAEMWWRTESQLFREKKCVSQKVELRKQPCGYTKFMDTLGVRVHFGIFCRISTPRSPKKSY